MKAILAAYAVGLRHGAELRGFMCMERGRGRIKGGMQRTALLQSQNVVDALAQMIQFRDLLRGGVDERGVSVCNNGIDRIMLKAVADARAIQRPQGDTKIPLPSESVTNAINVIYNSQHEKILRSRGKYEETPSELA